MDPWHFRGATVFSFFFVIFEGNRAKKKQVIRFAKLSARVTLVNLGFRD